MHLDCYGALSQNFECYVDPGTPLRKVDDFKPKTISATIGVLDKDIINTLEHTIKINMFL